jgi:hypothetical protein
VSIANRRHGCGEWVGRASCGGVRREVYFIRDVFCAEINQDMLLIVFFFFNIT